ncbi:MAG TPA: RNA-directed DNA polymerase [Gammaproteobacteria bacterium]|nr:RNA-directed DNA polymerase [Gammaproteobacteria bacterium]
MATRTTNTRTTSAVFAPSADSCPQEGHAVLSFGSLVAAYFDCRRTKRNTASALAFEVNLEQNLAELYEELINGTYNPGRSICFVITHPKPREVWAAAFRDRVVHHLIYNAIADRFQRRFIADSCACIPGRGTLYAVKRLESKIRSITQNWSRRAFYLKCDLANFFVAIDKRILDSQLADRIHEPFWLDLTRRILWHDPRTNYELHGNPKLLARVPQHKHLTNQPETYGLPIGNLSSQFFANVYLDSLDQFVKHQICCRHYIRYVDDFVLLHESPQWLNDAHQRINTFLPEQLNAHLNPKKTILQPIDRGVDFVGQVIKPWRRTVRRRTVSNATHRITTVAPDKLLETANSYFGLCRQATHSHRDRVRLSRAAFRRGHSVDFTLTKTFRRANF